MSDFVVNLVRRGAGLAPLVRPRRQDFPPEPGFPGTLPPEEITEESSGAHARAARPPGADRAPLSPGPKATLPARIDDRSPSVSRAEPAVADTHALPPPSPEPIVAASAVARTIPPPAGETQPTTPSPSTGSLSPTSAAEPPDVSALREERPLESADISVLVRAAPTLVDAPPTTRVSVPASPARAPVLLPPAPRSAGSDTPRVEVRIGRIEIIQAQPPTRPATRPRRLPRGFTDEASSRRYLGRRWY